MTRAMELRQAANKQKREENEAGFRKSQTTRVPPREPMRYNPPEERKRWDHGNKENDSFRGNGFPGDNGRHSPRDRQFVQRSPVRHQLGEREPYGRSQMQRSPMRHSPERRPSFGRKHEERSEYHYQRRVSDVSMRTATPVKSEIYYENSQMRSSRPRESNPFSKDQERRINPFKKVDRDNRGTNLFPKQSTSLNPFKKEKPSNPFSAKPSPMKPFPNQMVVNPYSAPHSPKPSILQSSQSPNPFVKQQTIVPKVFSKSKFSSWMGQKSVSKHPFDNPGKSYMHNSNFSKKQAEIYAVEQIRQAEMERRQQQKGPKTTRELLDDVMDYFLTTPIVREEDEDKRNSLYEDTHRAEMKLAVIKPLEAALLSNAQKNPSFRDLYEKNMYHDVQLEFMADGSIIKAHKHVLIYYSSIFDNYIKEHDKTIAPGEILTIQMKNDYNANIFSKVLKLMYLGNLKKVDINPTESRAMYKCACRIKAEFVQKFLICHCLLPQLSKENCLYILQDAFSECSKTHHDKSAKLLFEYTRVYCARRMTSIMNHDKRVLLKLDRKLLKPLVSKSLYFITDKSNACLSSLLKILIDKRVTSNIYDLIREISTKYCKGVTYDCQEICIEDRLNKISTNPVKFDLVLGDNQIKKQNKARMLEALKARNARQLQKYGKDQNLAKQSLNKRELWDTAAISKTPVDNQITSIPELELNDHDFEISLALDESFITGGVTYVSEIFRSFSGMWNLKIDVLESGSVSVYLVERGSYVQNLTQDAAQSQKMGLNAYQVIENVSSKKFLSIGAMAMYPLNFKSIAFVISVVDSRLNKDFKVFYSFSKDQHQIVGCEDFFNITQLGNQRLLKLRVKIYEEILHSAGLHLFASQFTEIAEDEIKSDPDSEKIVPYFLRQQSTRERSDDYRRRSWEKENRHYDYMKRDGYQNGRRKRPSTPPSELKYGLRFDRDRYDCQRDRHYDDRRSSKSTYLHLPYYDIAFMLDSDHLNIKNEYLALDAVFRYTTKVVQKEEITTRLIRTIRFNYLELIDLFNIAKTSKLLSQSEEFQAKFNYEISQRIKASVNPNIKIEQRPRIQYKLTCDDSYPPDMNVAEEITQWLIYGDHSSTSIAQK